jgi:hypothetical protein
MVPPKKENGAAKIISCRGLKNKMEVADSIVLWIGEVVEIIFFVSAVIAGTITSYWVTKGLLSLWLK